MFVLPAIDTVGTGMKIMDLRKKAGLSVKDLQNIFGFASPNAIYKWQNGAAMPTLDNLIVLAAIFSVAIGRLDNHAWADMNEEGILRSSGLILTDPDTGKEGITLAAILLFGKDSTIMSVLPQYKTDAIYRVKNMDRYDDRDVVITNLIDSFRRLMDFGKKHLNKFEAFPKNPPISKVFREIGYADELGSGMRNTNKYTKLYSGGTPIFIEDNIFRINIPIDNVANLKVGPGATAAEIIMNNDFKSKNETSFETKRL